MGAIALTLFAIAMALFQISCQKDATGIANVINNATQLNKVIFRKWPSGSLNPEIWICNYDGTNAIKVNINLPAGAYFTENCSPSISPNRQKIFFTGGPLFLNHLSNSGSLYSCNSDGTNLTMIVDGTGGSINLGAAYLFLIKSVTT